MIDTSGGNITSSSPFLAGTGAGNLTIQGGNQLSLPTGDTYTGTTTINSATLLLAAGGSSAGVLSGTPSITVNSAGTLLITSGTNDVLGFIPGQEALIINSGGTVSNNSSSKRETLDNTVTMTGGTLSGTSAGDSNTGAFSWNVSGGGLNAASDASGNAASISAATSVESSATVFDVTRGGAAANNPERHHQRGHLPL